MSENNSEYTFGERKDTPSIGQDADDTEQAFLNVLAEHGVTLKEIQASACGTDAQGNTRAVLTMVLNNIKSGQALKQKMSVDIATAKLQIYTRGGCVVLQADFQIADASLYHKAMGICNRYFSQREDGDAVGVYVLPVMYAGALTLLYTGLAYYVGFRIEKGFRLVLCFDHFSTMIYTADGMDMNLLTREAEFEMKMREAALDEQIEAATLAANGEAQTGADGITEAVMEEFGNIAGQDKARAEKPSVRKGYRIRSED